MIHQSCNHAAVLRLAPGSLSKRMLGKLLFAILGGSLKQLRLFGRGTSVFMVRHFPRRFTDRNW